MADDLTQFILRADAGTVLFKEGDPGDTMFFIHGGRVRIEVDVDGKAELLALLEKGDFFGEMAVLDHAPRTATAVVEEKAELLKVDSANFEKLLKANIEIAVRMIRKYAARLRETNAKLEALLRDRKAINEGIASIIHDAKSAPSAEVSTQPEAPLAELVGPAGSFRLLKATTTVGRQDPSAGIVPDIDLSSVDGGRSVSRRHARISLVDGPFFVTEEVGVANGTFVGDERLKPGAPAELADGARLRFAGIEFTFRAGGSAQQ
jgi:signal-transduction protein with cAMP-binding, CBS, and nucleotidyltransferase domain